MKKTSLFQWVWKTISKTLLVPLLMLGFLCMLLFFLANEWTRQQNIHLDRVDMTLSLLGQALNEADMIDKQLLSTTQVAEIYREQTAKALQSPAPDETSYLERLQLSVQGDYQVYTDRAEGGAAIYIPADSPMTEEKLKKVFRLLTLEGLMENLKAVYPSIGEMYFNSQDSISMIYPGADGFDPTAMPDFARQVRSFQGSASALAPDTGIKWTSPRMASAGNGWTVSRVAPVYDGNLLEGVVGVDIAIGSFVNPVVNLAVPWKGFGVLIDNEGMILSMSPREETLLGLKQFIGQDTGIGNSVQGVIQTTLSGKDHVVAWSTLPDTGWKLILFTPVAGIAKNANEVSDQVSSVGIWMLGIVVVFYILVIAIFYKLLQTMTTEIVKPLIHMKRMALEISNGNYVQRYPSYSIRELQDTSVQIVKMGEQLRHTMGQLESVRTETEAAKNNLTSIVQSLDDVVIILNEEGIIVNIWSNEACNLAAPPERMIGLPFARFVEARLVEEYRGVLRQVFESGKPAQAEYRVETVQGWRWRLGRLAPIRDGDGIVRTVSVFSKDITESKELEASLVKAKEEAELASKAKSEFLSNMSHQLRTPMNAILGFAQLLEYEELNEDQAENVVEILKAGHHLLALINDVLDLSRIEAGVIHLDMELTPLLTVVEDCLGMIEPMAADKGITLQHRVSADVTGLEVTLDRKRLKDILLNLLSNAVKYNKAKGGVSIHYEQANRRLKIHISDTGYGIAPDKLEKIFDSFYRIKEVPVNEEGTGIGLPIARRLIEQMGGSIEVESAVGTGSRFSVVIPLD